ncbi:MAG: outer membrane protein [Saprospiraceae bacterium]|jgi:outer membrane protein
MNRLFTFLLLVFLSVAGQSQENWSLQRCIEHAIENNLSIEQAELGVQFADIDVTQAKHNKYPTLNASSSLNNNFGRSIDPVTNDFITQSFVSNNVGLQTGVTIFNGFRIANSLKQAKIDQNASLSDLDQSKRDISLAVANNYLSALFADENLAIAKSQLETSNEQLSQTDKLINAGVRPANESLDILAQIAANEQQVIAAENSKVISLLGLKRLLRLEPNVSMVLEIPSNVNVESDPDILTFSDVYNSALQSQPNVKAGNLRIESARMGEKISKSGIMPRVSAFGSVGSNYNNKAQKFENFNDILIDTDVVINGDPATLGQLRSIPLSVSDNPYFNQLEENLSYGVGLSLNVPIYNNYSARLGIERSKLNVLNAENQNEQLKEQLKTTVQQALADARASKRKLNASEKSVDASNASFNNAEKRFNAGTINTFEYVTIKNALAQAEVNAVIAKYEYLFALKIIDFYMGKPIKL